MKVETKLCTCQSNDMFYHFFVLSFLWGASFLKLTITCSFNWIWKAKNMTKIKVFCWLLRYDRLNTKNKLKRRHYVINLTHHLKKQLIKYSSTAPLAQNPDLWLIWIGQIYITDLILCVMQRTYGHGLCSHRSSWLVHGIIGRRGTIWSSIG
jgi:hypothetical protein